MSSRRSPRAFGGWDQEGRPSHLANGLRAAVGAEREGEGRTGCTLPSLEVLRGSSPRVRGTTRVERVVSPFDRFIPAGAGNRPRSWVASVSPPVHPRGCGEQPRPRPISSWSSGSSPRVRGTGWSLSWWVVGPRFIPAGAGNSRRRHSWCWAAPVHPRGCGEQGSEERMADEQTGSSPRVRGTGGRRHCRPKRPRFIPAGAGNSRAVLVRVGHVTVHPRGCGEQERCGSAPGAVGGSSPRVRGTDRPGRGQGGRKRFIPAGAGNRARTGAGLAPRPVHPRGCGEQASSRCRTWISPGSSPRVRGTGRGQPGRHRGRRFIPAGAGTRSGRCPDAGGPAVHPRGCGEQASACSFCSAMTGSSPRVRGTAGPDQRGRFRRRFIPAGAGNSSRSVRRHGKLDP